VQTLTEFTTQKILISSAMRICLKYVIDLKKFLIKILKRRVPRTDPWGTLERTRNGDKRIPKIHTNYGHLDMQVHNQLTKPQESPKAQSFFL
jgi:hypothetical protein